MAEDSLNKCHICIPIENRLPIGTAEHDELSSAEKESEVASQHSMNLLNKSANL